MPLPLPPKNPRGLPNEMIEEIAKQLDNGDLRATVRDLTNLRRSSSRINQILKNSGPISRFTKSLRYVGKVAMAMHESVTSGGSLNHVSIYNGASSYHQLDAIGPALKFLSRVSQEDLIDEVLKSEPPIVRASGLLAIAGHLKNIPARQRPRIFEGAVSLIKPSPVDSEENNLAKDIAWIALDKVLEAKLLPDYYEQSLDEIPKLRPRDEGAVAAVNQHIESTEALSTERAKKNERIKGSNPVDTARKRFNAVQRGHHRKMAELYEEDDYLAKMELEDELHLAKLKGVAKDLGTAYECARDELIHGRRDRDRGNSL